MSTKVRAKEGQGFRCVCVCLCVRVRARVRVRVRACVRAFASSYLLAELWRALTFVPRGFSCF